jgi:hypothetical protein
LIKKSIRTAGLALILFGLAAIGVSAYVYQQATMTVSQTNIEIATLTLKNSDLGNINEGETLTLDNNTIAKLGDAIIITTTSQPVYLHLDSDLDSQSGSFTTYNITVEYATVASGGTGVPGNSAGTLSITSPDYSSITLDAVGTWTFNLEVTTTADSVDADTPTTITIIVTSESTS